MDFKNLDDQLAFWRSLTDDERLKLSAMTLEQSEEEIRNLIKSYKGKQDPEDLHDTDMDTAVAQWREMTPAQQAAQMARLKDLRRKVRQLPPFENPALESERQDPGWLPYALCKMEDEDGYESDPDYKGAEVPIEIYTLERLLSPTAAAWEQATRHTQLALRDDQIRRHPLVRSIFVQLAKAIELATWDDLATPENVLRLILDPLALDEVRKNDTARAAQLKNAGPIEWTQSMWTFLKALNADLKDIPSALESSLKDGSIPRANYTDAELRDFIDMLEIERNKPENKGLAMDRKFFSYWVWCWLKKHGFRAWSNKKKEDEVKEVKIGRDQIYKEWLKGL